MNDTLGIGDMDKIFGLWKQQLTDRQDFLENIVYIYTFFTY